MKIITVETLKKFLDELNRKYGTEFYTKAESDAKYQLKGNYAELDDFNNLVDGWGFELDKKADKDNVYTKVESDSKYQTKGDYVTTSVANETYLGKNALEEIKNRLDTIENIARTPTGSLVTYDLQEGLLGTIPERIQVIKVSCIESPKDFVFCGMRTSDRELSFYLDQTGSGVCLKLSNKNTRIETVTAAINIMPHFKIEWSYEINRQTPDRFFN